MSQLHGAPQRLLCFHRAVVRAQYRAALAPARRASLSYEFNQRQTYGVISEFFFLLFILPVSAARECQGLRDGSHPGHNQPSQRQRV